MIRTDLAMEAFAAGGASEDGIRHARRQYSPEIRIETVEILTASASEQLGKKQGKYVTVQAEYAVHTQHSPLFRQGIRIDIYCNTKNG